MVPLSGAAICGNMKVNTLAKLAWSLDHGEHELVLDEEVRRPRRAVAPPHAGPLRRLAPADGGRGRAGDGRRAHEEDLRVGRASALAVPALPAGSRGAGHGDDLQRELAERGGTTSAQVRKDLSLFGSFGKRGLGYSVQELLSQIREILGLARGLAGGAGGRGEAGLGALLVPRLRGARLPHPRRLRLGPRQGRRRLGRPHGAADEEMERVLREAEVEIAILAVPADAAQGVVDRLVRAPGCGDPQLRPGAAAGPRARGAQERGRDAGAGGALLRARKP
jgi:hypothetical protein